MKEPNEYTADDIKNWLEALPGEKIVGRCRDSHNCLIANFLLREGYSVPSVEPYGSRDAEPHITWLTDTAWQEVSMPESLAVLGRNFDELAFDERPISAAKALELFEEAGGE